MAIFKCSMCGASLEVAEGETLVVCDYCGTTQAMAQQSVDAGACSNEDALLRRAELALEFCEWDRVNDFCEQALNQDPECAAAYLYKLMAKLKISERSELVHCVKPFNDDIDCQKASRFDKAICMELAAANRAICEREEERHRHQAYGEAELAWKAAITCKDFDSAAKAFEELGDYSDAADKAEEIRAQWKRIALLADDIAGRYIPGPASMTELERLRAQKVEFELEMGAESRIQEAIDHFMKEIDSLEHELYKLQAERDGLGLFDVAKKRHIDERMALNRRFLLDAKRHLSQAQAKAPTLRDKSLIERDIQECEKRITAEEDAENARRSAGGGVRYNNSDLRDPRVLLQVAERYPNTFALLEDDENAAYTIATTDYLKAKGPKGSVRDSLQNGTFAFGRWGGEDITWYQIDEKDGKSLLLSTFGIDCKRFNSKHSLGAINNWKTCDLKKWLEGEFEKGAFNVEEKSRIVGHPFCLSTDEVTKLLPEKRRICKATSYAQQNGVYTNDTACDWWLRSSGYGTSTVVVVCSNGKLRFNEASTCDPTYFGHAVRPALWLSTCY